jgi:hypothetical protein
MSHKLDLVGQVYGRLQVEAPAEPRRVGKQLMTAWHCSCVCRKHTVVLTCNLRSRVKPTRSCRSCKLKPTIDRTPRPVTQPWIPIGVRFDRLTVIADAGRPRCGGIRRQCYFVRCTCDAELIVCRDSLLGKNTRSCGCLPMPKRGPRSTWAYNKGSL